MVDIDGCKIINGGSRSRRPQAERRKSAVSRRRQTVTGHQMYHYHCQVLRKGSDSNSNPFINCAELILPWLTPQELASVSSTDKTLNRICKSITTIRTSDAARSFEKNPIPFINSVDSHRYAYFLYTHSHHFSSFSRQFWGSVSAYFRPTPALHTAQFMSGFTNWIDEASSGCDCGEKCSDSNSGVVNAGSSDCPCRSLILEESSGVITECGEGCKCAAACGNRVSQNGVSVKVKIVRDRNKGWCLVADQRIPSRLFVCEYAGELLTTKEARRRQKRYDELALSGQFSAALLVVREHLPSGKACLRINIDATRIGNVARFINHSCDGGNLSTVLVRTTGALLPRVCFFASRDIEEGEELTFSYGTIRMKAEGLRCFCGSSSCFGILPSENT